MYNERNSPIRFKAKRISELAKHNIKKLILVNEVWLSDFDMGEKEKKIQNIKESNKDIQRLQGMDIN